MSTSKASKLVACALALSFVAHGAMPRSFYPTGGPALSPAASAGRAIEAMRPGRMEAPAPAPMAPAPAPAPRRVGVGSTSAQTYGDNSDISSGFAAAPTGIPTSIASPPSSLQDQAPSGPRCLVAWLQQHPEYSTLLSLVRAVPADAKLTDKLEDPSAGITLFAPDNIAINKTLTSLGLGISGLLADPTLVLEILQFHMLPNPIVFSQLKDGYSFNTLLPSSNFAQSLTVSRSSNNQVRLMGGKVPVLLREQGQKVCLDMVYPTSDMLLPPSSVA